MKTIVKGKNFEVPEADRRYAERKLARLDRILDDRTDALVELSVESHRSLDDSRIVEVTLVIDGRTLRGRAAAVSHRAAIDVVVDKLERRAVDHRRKPRVRARPTEEKHILSRIADGTAESGHPGGSSRRSGSASSRCSKRTPSPRWRSSATASSCSSTPRPSAWPCSTGATTAISG